MREVPRLDPATEAELLRRYAAAEGVTNKYRLVKILVHGGSHGVTALITNALTQEFRDKEVTRTEEGLLVHLASLLGLVARRDLGALDFLLSGVQEGFWEGLELWRVEGRGAPPGVLRGQCLKGLAWSGQPEGLAMLDALRGDPGRAAVLDVTGALVDAAFVRDMVEQHGIEEALDVHLLKSLEDRMRSFRQWKLSTNGQWWDRWWEEANRLRPPSP
jgi:hypothetical protein